MKAPSKLVSLLLPGVAASLALAVSSASTQSTRNSSKALTSAEFRCRMTQLANAWNRGDARAAADLFAEDAFYSSPPGPKIHEGRWDLFEWFGGSQGRPKPMRMEWHHFVFDEEEQIGAGEYTFTYEVRTHGMVLVRLRDGKISNWREYEIESPLDWSALVGKNNF